MRMHLAISHDALVQFDESIEFWSNFNLKSKSSLIRQLFKSYLLQEESTDLSDNIDKTLLE